jgi:hypothetical protein
VSGAPFRAIGGAIVSDHGVIALAEVRTLAVFYASEAKSPFASAVWRRLADDRARALKQAAAEAEGWRRAAGWTDPDVADQA